MDPKGITSRKKAITTALTALLMTATVNASAESNRELKPSDLDGPGSGAKTLSEQLEQNVVSRAAKKPEAKKHHTVQRKKAPQAKAPVTKRRSRHKSSHRAIPVPAPATEAAVSNDGIYEAKLREIDCSSWLANLDSLTASLAIPVTGNKSIDACAHAAGGEETCSLKVDRYFEFEGKKFIADTSEYDPYTFRAFKSMEGLGYAIIRPGGDNSIHADEKILSRLGIEATRIEESELQGLFPGNGPKGDALAVKRKGILNVLVCRNSGNDKNRAASGEAADGAAHSSNKLQSAALPAKAEGTPMPYGVPFADMVFNPSEQPRASRPRTVAEAKKSTVKEAASQSPETPQGPQAPNAASALPTTPAAPAAAVAGQEIGKGSDVAAPPVIETTAATAPGDKKETEHPEPSLAPKDHAAKHDHVEAAASVTARQSQGKVITGSAGNVAAEKVHDNSKAARDNPELLPLILSRDPK